MWEVDTEVSEQHVAYFWTVTELHLSSTEDTKRRRLTPCAHYVKNPEDCPLINTSRESLKNVYW